MRSKSSSEEEMMSVILWTVCSCALASRALRLLDGEPECFGVFVVEPARVGLRRREGASEDRREDLVLRIHRRAASASPAATLSLARCRS